MSKSLKLCFRLLQTDRISSSYKLFASSTSAPAIVGIYWGGSRSGVAGGNAAAFFSDYPGPRRHGRGSLNSESKSARDLSRKLPPRTEQPWQRPHERIKQHSPSNFEKRPKTAIRNDSEVQQHVLMSSDFCDHRGMQIVFLGTSSSMPTLSRNTSSVALRLDGRIYIFDCGEGVQRQLHRTPFRQRTIDSIFITHMHGDHCLCSRYSDFQGLRQWIRTTLKLCHARLPIKYTVHELILQEETWKRAAKWNVADEKHDDELPGEDIFCSEDGLWHVHEDDKYVVVAGLLKHSIPCWGYVVEEKLRPGRFSVDRAVEAGVQPGPMYAMLQKGHEVSLSDGRVVKPSDVLGPPRKGRKVVILGDTSDSRSLLIAARGADVVVHEATVVEEEADLAASRGHSTASMAGTFARSLNANTLVLTHFSGKLEGSLYGTLDKGTISELVSAARRTFGRNSVMAAQDLTAVTVYHQEDSTLSVK